MNSTLLLNIARFLLLVAAQVLIFNEIDFSGYVNPYPYLLFILLYPVNGNRPALLAASFLMGIIIDMFCNSGGVHATACVIVAYLRPAFFKFSFGVSYEYQTVKINDKLTPERFSFLLISVFTHHIILFLLEIFKFDFILDILFKTLLSSVFTLVMCIIIIYIFKPSSKR
ncbi:MAG TPA: rod shape-determining protein MreD [Flavobacterium sp.]|nr:rod shape-determining protein MreD [Flavobacterium sp.]